MGYETRLVIGTEYRRAPSDKVALVQRIAEVDLSKAGHDTATGKLLAKAAKSDEHYGFYADNGDDVVMQDRYDAKLTAVDLDALIAAMEIDQIGEYYRRFALALALLRAFRDDPSWAGESLRVVQFGH